MSHFSLKSLTFYGVAIGSVTLLFNVITAYGEANLKAPPSINGNYSLEGQDLPGCLKSQAMKLVILQSGSYLNGAIVPIEKVATEPNSHQEKPALIGRFQKGELSLSGNLPALPACSSSTNSNLDIQGRVTEEILQGKIKLNDQSIPFRSPRQKPEMSNSH
jgi:hypothetical protein